jgi:hypothetical protein
MKRGKEGNRARSMDFLGNENLNLDADHKMLTDIYDICTQDDRIT